jgi:ribonuclease J
VNMAIEIAIKHGRKVCVVGRSMLNVIAHARQLGYIKCPDSVFEPLQSANSLPDNKVMILCTGSQGEPLAAMTRIANGEHRQLRVRPTDTVIFSANPIPGNTISVVRVIDTIMMQGANVIYGRDKGIHVSGHGCQEDHKLMLSLTRPKFFIPVHGEHRMLIQHSRTAQSMGIPADKMVIIDNGDIVELTESSMAKNGKVPSGIQLVDQAGIVHDRASVMTERQQLADEGVMTVSVGIDSNGKLTSKPQVILRGIVTGTDTSLITNLIQKTIENCLEDRWSKFARSFESGQKDIDWTGLQIEFEQALQRLSKREFNSRPLIVVMLQTPATGADANNAAPLGRRRQRSTAKVGS